MKKFVLPALIVLVIACNNTAPDQAKELQTRIDSLEKKLNDAYKPGFGEFMSGIQAHHTKLWFAGKNENWKLADFEVHEIMEAIEDIQKYETERSESQMIGMINPALDSVNEAIRSENPEKFRSSFTLLTNTCNNCHKTANFGFNKVQIPETEPFPNQDFGK